MVPRDGTGITTLPLTVAFPQPPHVRGRRCCAQELAIENELPAGRSAQVPISRKSPVAQRASPRRADAIEGPRAFAENRGHIGRVPEARDQTGFKVLCE
jgi:hypothetical protein